MPTYLSQNLKKLNILKTKEKTFGQLKREIRTAVFWKKNPLKIIF